MRNSLALTVITWAALLCIMALCAWHLADGFAPEYPEEPVRYTTQSYKSLEYENAQNRAARIRAERFIREMAEGNIR